MSCKLIPGITAAGLALIFIIQNFTIVELKFLFWTLSISRALLIFLILSLGIILGRLLHSYFHRIKTVKMQNKSL